MKTAVVTSATGEPLTLEEVKSQLRIEVGETIEDDLLLGLITVARQRAEEITGRKLMPQTWYSYHDEWPKSPNYDRFDLPYAPASTIPSTGLVYTDSEGDSTTFSSTAWASDIVAEPGRLVLDYNDDWPTVTLHNNNPIRIEVQYGYAGSTVVPESIKLAMKLMIGHWYENREDTVLDLSGGRAIYEIPNGAKALLQPYRLWKF